MWAYTDEETDFLSPAYGISPRAKSPAGKESSPAASLPARALGWFVLPKSIRTWLNRRTAEAELYSLDHRTLADLAINRGDFPAILGGTFTRDDPAS